MFVPRSYRPEKRDDIWPVIRQNPLAALVTNGPSVPYVTHLPVIPAGPAIGDPVGATLFGHLNRANPHWTALSDKCAGKLLFTGPGAYISPAIYDADPAAPTWNFVSVHIEGSMRVITDVDETLEVVRRTAMTLEGAFGRGWDPNPSVDYFRSIVRGVGAFELRVEAADAMFKLSQDKAPAMRQRVSESLCGSAPGSAPAQIGDLMHDREGN